MLRGSRDAPGDLLRLLRAEPAHGQRARVALRPKGEGSLEGDIFARQIANEDKVVGSERGVVRDHTATLARHPLLRRGPDLRPQRFDLANPLVREVSKNNE